MRKITFICIFTCTVIIVYSQDYSFKKSYGQYIHLTDADTISNLNWDDPYILTKLPFKFNILENEYDTVYVTDGGLAFGCKKLGGFITCDRYINIFNCDFLDRNLKMPGNNSFIFQKLNDSFTIEWYNAGFYEEFDVKNTMNDSVSVQVTLKKDYSISIHIGSNKIIDENVDYYGEKGGYFGIWNNNDKSQSYMISGNPDNPSLVKGDITVTLEGTPAEGTIYKFFQKESGVKSFSFTDAVRVNQSMNSLILHNKSNYDIKITVSYIDGKSILSPNLLKSKNAINIDLESVNSSIVIVSFIFHDRTYSKKVFIY